MSLLGLVLSGPVPDCKTFNASKIELITFDVFAALMDLFPSLERNIGRVVPSLEANLVKAITYDWVSYYGSLAGQRFTRGITGHEEPFVWMSRSGLVCNLVSASSSKIKILENRRLTKIIPINSTVFNSMLGVWGDLIPWDNTIEVVTKLARTHKGQLLN